ncbi:MAG: SGNH/GDSL hydrolase family protein [Bacilli bacterium]
MKRLLLLLALFAIPLFIIVRVQSTTGTAPLQTNGSVSRPSAAPRKAATSKHPTVRVMVIGSSVALGWDDPIGGGYLARAFRSLTALGGANYQVFNRAQPGAGVRTIENQYLGWVKSVKPQIVVISWGALDNLHNKTPISVFRQQIHWEIQSALTAHAVVFIVTPPITKASYTEYPTQEPFVLDNEMYVANSFHSNNVYVFDVFDQMKAYLVAHHQTYVPYMADGWHPNAKGHALAGHLLYMDMLRQFGTKTVTLRN